jgi:TusA-related sulfurtransferase
LEVAIPVIKIASLSSGEFVGMVADNPDQKIELKAFCAEIINDHKVLEKEQAGYAGIPQYFKVESKDILENFLKVKSDVAMIVQTELERMIDTPELTDLIIKKK